MGSPMRGWVTVLFLLLIGVVVLSFESIAAEDPEGSDHEMGAHFCGINFYWFHPNQTKVFHFWVENQGLLPDSYVINFTIDDPRWKWELDHDFFPDVPGQEMRYFNLSLTSPPDGKAGQYINATLTASSMTVNLTESISWKSFIIVERAVDLECADRVKETDSGDVVFFELMVRNIGDLEDTYRIEYTLEDPDLGWEVEVPEGLLNLDVKESGNFTVRLTAPEQGVENCTLYIYVKSTNDTFVWDRNRLVCQVRHVWSASLEPQTCNWTVGPDQLQEVRLELAQQTNDLKAHDWVVELLFNPNGWEAWTDLTSLTLSGTARANITLYVLSPIEIPIGRKLTIAVVLRCKQLPLESVRADVGFRIGEVHGLELGVFDWQAQTPSGEVVSFTIRANNTGNTQEVFQVVTSGPEGWEVEAWTGQIHDGWFSVEPGRTLSMDLRVEVPGHAPPGNTMIYATLRSHHLESNTIAVTVEVLRTQRIQLGPIEQEKVVLDLYGEQVVVEVPLYNKGNIGILVFLEAKTDIEGCRVIIAVNGLVLGPGTESSFHIGLSVDEDAPFGRGNVSFTAFVEKSNVSETLDVPLMVVGPDVKIRSISYHPSLLRPGEPVTVNVSVLNVGKGTCPRFNATLKGPFFGGDPEPVVLPPLGPGENSSAIFIVKPMSGTYRWIYEVDPDDSIREDSESENNVLEYRKRVFPPDEPDNSLLSLFILAIVFLSIIGLGFAHSIWVTKRRTSIHYDEESEGIDPMDDCEDQASEQN